MQALEQDLSLRLQPLAEALQPRAEGQMPELLDDVFNHDDRELYNSIYNL